jgi:hypothetical protein
MTKRQARTTKRQARTRSGKLVDLDTLERGPGGWYGYILRHDGYAVYICVPDRDEDSQ